MDWRVEININWKIRNRNTLDTMNIYDDKDFVIILTN